MAHSTPEARAKVIATQRAVRSAHNDPELWDVLDSFNERGAKLNITTIDEAREWSENWQVSRRQGKGIDDKPFMASAVVDGARLYFHFSSVMFAPLDLDPSF
jgi:hypothetical protein